MKERDLYPAVRDWLKAQGWTVHVEIFDADIVAERNGELLVVEMKMSMNDHLFNQLCDRARWADYGIAAVPASAYRKQTMYLCEGFGVLTIANSKAVRRIKARPQPWRRIKTRKYRFAKLRSRLPAQDHECAGLPACRELADNRRLARRIQDDQRVRASERDGDQI